jgi:hypothetical protein
MVNRYTYKMQANKNMNMERAYGITPRYIQTARKQDGKGVWNSNLAPGLPPLHQVSGSAMWNFAHS